MQKERKTVAPSQRIIHRKSPKRRDRRAPKEEEEELLNYDSAPRARHQFRGSSQTSDTESFGRGDNHPAKPKSMVRDKETSTPSLPEEDGSSGAPMRHSSPQKQASHLSHRSSQPKPQRGGTVETDIDFAPSDGSQASHRQPGGPQSPKEPVRSSRDTPRNSNTPSSSRGSGDAGARTSGGAPSPLRILKGAYVPLAQNEDLKEEFV